MTHTATYRRLDLGPLTADVTEHHEIVIRYDHDGYARIHEDTLGPLLRFSGYELEQPIDACPECEHTADTPADWCSNRYHPANRPEEAAALRSAPLANEQPCPVCSRTPCPTRIACRRADTHPANCSGCQVCVGP